MNKNIWNLYKNSERGKDSIALFTFDSEKDDLEVKAKEIFQKYNAYFWSRSAEDYFLDRCFSIIDNIFVNKLLLDESENASEYFERLIDNLEISFVEENMAGELVKVENERPIVKQKDYKIFCGILTEISLILYFYGEVFYVPMLFREQFDVFM